MSKKRNSADKYEKGYFYEDEEKAVIDYINASTFEEKNKIFEETLKPALYKMVEIIIRRYTLYQKDEDFRETFDDTLSFIMTKIDKYKEENGRAYSYIGTMCKNHLIGRNNDTRKLMTRNISYDEMSNEINESEEYSYTMSESINSNMNEIISATANEISTLINSGCSKLSKKEIMVGKALVEILSNWDELFKDLGSNKFNKSSILLYIKEVTNLSTKEVNSSMRKYKILYTKTKQFLL